MNKLLIMRTHLLWIGVMTASSLWLSGCTQEEKYPFFPEKGYDSGTVIPLKMESTIPILRKTTWLLVTMLL